MRFSTTALVCAATAAAVLARPAAPVDAGPIAYPPTPVHEVADTLHGQVIVDPYRWLEEDDSPAVREWTDAENALTRKALDGFAGRKAIEDRLAQLYAIPVFSRPQLHGGRLFYSKRAGGQNQPVVMTRLATKGSAASPLLDPNTLSADGTVALDWIYPSPDGALIAYGVSANGSEQSTLHVRRVDDGQDLQDQIPNTAHASLAWDKDGKGFHYTRHPQKGEVPAGEEVFHTRVFHHALGDDPARDALVFGGEGRPIQEQRGIDASSDGAWLFLRTSLDWAKNDVFLRPAGSQAEWEPIARGLDGLTSPDAWKGRLYLRTNVDAPRYRIVVADPAAPTRDHWKPLVPEQDGVIEDFELAGGRIALSVTDKAISRLLIYDLAGKLEREVHLPALGEVSSLTGEPETSTLFFNFESFALPATTYRCDVATGAIAPLEKSATALDPQSIEARQEWVTSADGTRLPFFVVQRKGNPKDGRRPTILTGYGGFEVSEMPGFQPNAIPWIEAGGVYVLANLRGGGEFGKAWHEAGRLDKKQNVFDDFYAVARGLVSSGLTRADRIAAMGGSNGGLLVGAALTQHPELFGAVVCRVPLLDMIRYQRFSIARYWVPEYGSSEDPEQFPFLYAYSPYQHVKAGTAYPATLLTAAESDSRVAPLHARKMAALLQARTAGDAPILLRIESKAGHGAGKPTQKRIAESADILSFLMMRLGLSPGS